LGQLGAGAAFNQNSAIIAADNERVKREGKQIVLVWRILPLPDYLGYDSEDGSAIE
jgi:hypothetical protein